MIYVDEALYKKKNGKKKFCHMIADSYDELHMFAEKIGIGKHFFHSSSKYPHYDLNEEQRQDAINNGASEITSKRLVILSRIINNNL